MNWTFLIVIIVVTSSTAQIRTLRSHSSQDSSATVRKIREPKNLAALTKWELQTIKQLQKINKLIRTLKSENGGCSKGVNTPKYCQLHWLPDTLLRLSVRIDSKNNEIQLQTEGEKEIHEKHLMINKLIENMVSVTDCSKDKEEKKKEEERKKALSKSKKKEDKKGKDEKAKAKDDKKKEKEKTTETEEKKKESKEAGVTEGQTEAEDKVTPPDVSEETSGSGSGTGDEDGREETSVGETEGEASGEKPVTEADGGEEEEETGEGDPAAETGDGDPTAETGDGDPTAETGDEDTEESEDVQEEEKTSDCDYSNFGPSHTMMLPPSDCQIHKTGLDEGDKEEILRLHNALRAKVARGEETEGAPGPQPPASNMRELVWNDQLAEVAEGWAKQCKQGHDQIGARKICSRNYFVGQNLHFYYGPSPEVDWENAVNEWYKEVADMPNEIAGSYRSLLPATKIGHYSQVVWADTNEIGCGIVHYAIEHSGRFFPEAKMYACNYGQSGNVVTFPIYQQGPAASQCPDGVSENYPDLCA